MMQLPGRLQTKENYWYYRINMYIPKIINNKKKIWMYAMQRDITVN